jgi:HSP20 family protein
MWGLNDFDRTFDVFDELRRTMDQAFVNGGAAASAPRANVYDTGGELVIEADVPGIAEQDLQLTLTQDTLVLAGERKLAAPEGHALHRRERGDQRFSRSFALPTKVDPDRAVAALKDGVLTVTLPKAAEVRPRQITVKAA